jgi:hypothetical protein
MAADFIDFDDGFALFIVACHDAANGWVDGLGHTKGS